jgi:hypothetical protein
MVIPIAIILALVAGPVVRAGGERYSFASGGILFLPTALMLLFRRKYPGWWCDWNPGFHAVQYPCLGVPPAADR